MLQLTLTSGRVVQRVFCGHINNLEDLKRFYREMEMELADNTSGKPVLCEAWKDITPPARKLTDYRKAEKQLNGSK